MRPVIQIDDNLVSIIRASEVIHEPVCVVKELVENAIDAGATDIKVDYTLGGKSSLTVRDNGHGMARADLDICLARHTSSKTYTKEEAVTPASLGFRGEALHSIASVAGIEITTWDGQDQDCGWHLSRTVNGSQSIKPAQKVKGTMIAVQSLFGQVPARLKALPSDNACSAKINDLVQRYAIIYPQVTFHLKGKKVDGSGTYILGDARQIVSLDADLVEGKYHVSAKVHEAKSDRVKGLISVDGRMIEDKAIEQAILSAAQQARGDHKLKANYILSLTVSESAKDEVNIHLHPKKTAISIACMPNLMQDLKAVLREKMTTPVKEAITSSVYQISALEDVLENEIDLPLGKPLFQFNNSWIFAERRDEIVVIDQHAAHERIIMEIMRKAVDEATIRSVEIDPIMISSEDIGAFVQFEEYAPTMWRAGFSFGFKVENYEVYLNAVPSYLPETTDWVKVFRNGPDERDAVEVGLDLPTLSCKRAIKFGHALSIPQMRWLLREMEKTPSGMFCNHGRPTVKKLTDTKLQDLFGRLA